MQEVKELVESRLATERGITDAAIQQLKTTSKHEVHTYVRTSWCMHVACSSLVPGFIPDLHGNTMCGSLHYSSTVSGALACLKKLELGVNLTCHSNEIVVACEQ